MANTLLNLIKNSSGAQCAIKAVQADASGLSYTDLLEQIEYTACYLSGLGIGCNDPVAIVMPNGPEMVSAFIATASFATAAPLNPGLRQQEYLFYLKDMAAKLLIVAADFNSGVDPDVKRAAAELGIPVIELAKEKNQSIGRFELQGLKAQYKTVNKVKSAIDERDIALILHTSGTTSKPKLVPLSHGNICSSARNIATHLNLGVGDCCLNIMPLFHIHGLIGSALSSFSAGAAIGCSPGFDAIQFFNGLNQLKPTWYTAVPSMHLAIVSRAKKHNEIIKKNPLRFIRSSSSPLPRPLLIQLEQTFNTSVIEAYGMTEAAHQITSNPLPPGQRKPGTVGIATGTEIAVIDPKGNAVLPNTEGEVIIKGASVMAGYRNNSQANTDSYKNGWLRTGDQGVIDAQGYLRLTGRLKEIINRGGEKISPLEVDEILLNHPAVMQAMTFAIPHKSLGEEVAAAVVFKPGELVSNFELRDFLRARLAPFKVPRQFIFVDEIPKGPTGKPQRLRLAAQLGLDHSTR